MTRPASTAIELFHGYTYSGHPLACAAALATLDIYGARSCSSARAAMAPYWRGRRAFAATGRRNVIDIRNIGLVAGIELAPGGRPRRSARLRRTSALLRAWPAGAHHRRHRRAVAAADHSEAQIDEIVEKLADAIAQSSEALRMTISCDRRQVLHGGTALLAGASFPARQYSGWRSPNGGPHRSLRPHPHHGALPRRRQRRWRSATAGSSPSAAAPRSEASPARARRPSTRSGMTIVPGFIDCHNHAGGKTLLYEVLVGNPFEVEFVTIASIVDKLRAKARQTPPGTWVEGYFYDDTKVKDKRAAQRARPRPRSRPSIRSSSVIAAATRRSTTPRRSSWRASRRTRRTRPAARSTATRPASSTAA